MCVPGSRASRLRATQVTNWFEGAEENLKKKAVPKAAFLDDFFAGKS